MAFKSLTKAYEAIGLVHNDTHAQNVLIIPKRTSEIDGIQCHGYGIAFMDFENSLISQDKSQRQFTYKDIARLVSDIHYTSELNLTGIVELIAEIEKHRSLNTVFDEASRHIFLKVDELNFSIQLPSKTLIYDPNVFF
jgi:hypothetical protein